MLGNAREWCSDRFDSGYYGSSEKFVDPHGPVNEDRSRVIRGSSYRTDGSPVTRAILANSSADRDLGFRLVVEAEAK